MGRQALQRQVRMTALPGAFTPVQPQLMNVDTPLREEQTVRQSRANVLAWEGLEG